MSLCDSRDVKEITSLCYYGRSEVVILRTMLADFHRCLCLLYFFWCPIVINSTTLSPTTLTLTRASQSTEGVPSCPEDENPCTNGAPCVGMGNSDDYICQCLPGYAGRNCDVDSFQNCGSNYYSSSGYFTSPNFPNEYNHRMNCHYYIRIYGASSIKFTVHEFDTELLKDVLSYAPGYQVDYGQSDLVELQDDLSDQVPFNFTIDGDSAWFVLESDRTILRTGFNISFISDSTTLSPATPTAAAIENQSTEGSTTPTAVTMMEDQSTEDSPTMSPTTVTMMEDQSTEGPPSCPADDNPCANGAPCVGMGNSTNDYICQCLVGFAGRNCDVVSFQNCGSNYYSSPGYFTSPNFPNEYNNRMNCHYYIRIYGASSIKFMVHEFDTEVKLLCNVTKLLNLRYIRGNRTEDGPGPEI